MSGRRLQCLMLLTPLFLVGCRPERTVSMRPVDAESEEAVAGVYCIELTGTDHRWIAQYPEADGVVPFPYELRPGHDLHMPIDTEVALILKSTDYLYTMVIPSCGLKEIAVPGLEFRLVHRWQLPGTHELEGEELCGVPGQRGPGRLVVERRDKFLAWLRCLSD